MVDVSADRVLSLSLTACDRGRRSAHAIARTTTCPCLKRDLPTKAWPPNFQQHAVVPVGDVYRLFTPAQLPNARCLPGHTVAMWLHSWSSPIYASVYVMTGRFDHGMAGMANVPLSCRRGLEFIQRQVWHYNWMNCRMQGSRFWTSRSDALPWPQAAKHT